MLIEIECEAETKFVSTSLFESVQMIYETIEELSQIEGDLQPRQQEDLDDALRDIEGLKIAYKYYTVSSEWSNLNQFEVIEDEKIELLGNDLLISASDL